MLKNTLKGYIKKFPVVMVSLEGCPFCMRARGLLSSEMDGEKYHIVDMTGGEKPQYVEACQEITGTNHRTFPMIWVKEEFIGGSDSLQEYSESNDLSKL
eukprot:snap_masked-scaffold_6-processed-gene-19.39-mRNA-1 protein AED:1.00 eAED:1.00 QI:0/-1/0/0/-1/1/1/0/98